MAEHIPAEGGFVAVVNHVSHVDPLTFAHFLYHNGRLPRFLGKEVLFRLFFVGRVLRGAKQIPVYRESGDASKAFSAAVAAVRAGECVAIYPEATLTRDPDLWPMVGKTGAARVALETGAPGDPGGAVGAAGAAAAVHQAAAPASPARPCTSGPARRSTSTTCAAAPWTRALLHEVTERIMAAMTALLEEIRGEQAPAERFDPQAAGPARDRRPAASPR